MNRKSSVADSTRARVLRVIDQIGYRPRGGPFAVGHLLPNLSDGGGSPPGGIGVIIKEDDNPFYAAVVGGARAALTTAGYTVFASSSEGDDAEEDRLLDALEARAFAGAIIAPVAGADADLSHLFRLRAAGFPLVVLEEVRGLRADSVSINGVSGSEAAVRHLFELGHREVRYFAGPAYTRRDDRLDGVRRAFSASPLVFTDDVIVEVGAHLEDGYRAGLRVFADADARPTAVACFNDLVAMGLLRALHELGLRVPHDVSVVGYDDIPSAAYLSPPLTTVRSPAQTMGRQAAELLLRRIAPPSDGEGPADLARVLLSPELVVRESTRSLT